MAKYFDKLGFQMWMQNQAFMRLPREYRGCWLDLRMMAGSDEQERGYIPIGAKAKAKFDDVVDFLGLGEEESRAHYKKVVKALLMVGALEQTAHGTMRIGRYEDEQGLGKSDGTYRGRKSMGKVLKERIERSPGYMEALFKRCAVAALPRDVVLGELKKKNRCNGKTAELIVAALRGDGCLCVSPEGTCTLASLAAPPVSVSGSERETYAPRKFNVDRETETELRDSNESPIESTDAHAPVSDFEGGAASEASVFAPVGRPASPLASSPASSGRVLRDGDAAPGMLPRVDEPLCVQFDEAGLLASPEDVWEVNDPLLATEALLRTKSGWSDMQKPGRPPSTFALRKKFTDVMEAAGRDPGVGIWRLALFEIYLEHAAGNTSIKSWVAVFGSKVNAMVKEKHGVDLSGKAVVGR